MRKTPLEGSCPRPGGSLPDGAGVRCDHALVEGGDVSSFYDPMIAKIIAHGPDRATATQRLRRALTRLTVLGITHNAGFLVGVLDHPDFLSGAVHTGWLEAARIGPVSRVSDADVAIAGWLTLRRRGTGGPGWRSAGLARSTTTLQLGDLVTAVEARFLGSDSLLTVSGIGAGEPLRVRFVTVAADRLRAEVDGVVRSWSYAWGPDRALHLQGGDGAAWRFVEPRPGVAEDGGGGDGRVVAPMSGRVVSVAVAVGDTVARGDALLTLEAMKLQSSVEAPVGGTVRALSVAAGGQVQAGQAIVQIEPDP